MAAWGRPRQANRDKTDEEKPVTEEISERPIFVHERSIGGHSGRVYGCAISPDGKLLATGCSDGCVRIFDSKNGSLVYSVRFNSLLSNEVRGVVWTADGRRLFATSSGGGVYEITRPSSSQQWSDALFYKHYAPLLGCAVSVHNVVAVCCGGHRILLLSGSGKGNVLQDIQLHSSQWRIVFSDDGALLCATTMGGSTHFGGRFLSVFRRNSQGAYDILFMDMYSSTSESISALRFSPDSSQLLVGCWDGRVFVRNVGLSRQDFSAHPIAHLDGHTDGVLGLAFAGDGYVLSGSKDKSIRIWHIPKTLQPVYVWYNSRSVLPVALMDTPGAVEGMAFHAETGLLAATIQDRGVELWRCAPRGPRPARGFVDAKERLATASAKLTEVQLFESTTPLPVDDSTVVRLTAQPDVVAFMARVYLNAGNDPVLLYRDGGNNRCVCRPVNVTVPEAVHLRIIIIYLKWTASVPAVPHD